MGKSADRLVVRGLAAWVCGLVIVGTGLSGASAGAAGLTVPSAPKITSVTAGLNKVSVAFSKPATDGGTRITTYRVTCTSANGGGSGSHQGFASPITVAGLTSAKTYTCVIAAINKIGSGPLSAPSGKAVVLPTAPAPPVITLMSPGFHNVTISFKPASTGGAPITNYKVTCKDDDGTKSHQSFTSPITIACVNGAETYTCTVAAENRIGWSHSSPTSSPAISLPVTPGPPTITSVTAGVRSIAVSVAKPTNDGGVRISNYRATCVSSNGGVSGSHQSFTATITVAGLSSGRTYTCTAFAINQVSVSPASVPSAAVVPFS